MHFAVRETFTVRCRCIGTQPAQLQQKQETEAKDFGDFAETCVRDTLGVIATQELFVRDAEGYPTRRTTQQTHNDNDRQARRQRTDRYTAA